MFTRTEKLVFNFDVPIKFFSFIGVHQAKISDCACPKRKCILYYTILYYTILYYTLPIRGGCSTNKAPERGVREVEERKGGL